MELSRDPIGLRKSGGRSRQSAARIAEHDVRIVLVGARHPGNIGSTARAMKTMGLVDLALVAPERFPRRRP